MRSFCDYVIHFRMAKAHKCPLTAVCTGVCKEAWREVAFGSLILWGSKLDEIVYRKEQSNDRNGRLQLIVGFVEVSLLLLLPKVATAGKNVWMVNLLGSDLLLRHGNPYCTLRLLPMLTAIRLYNRVSFLPFAQPCVARLSHQKKQSSSARLFFAICHPWSEWHNH